MNRRTTHLLILAATALVVAAGAHAGTADRAAGDAKPSRSALEARPTSCREAQPNRAYV
ncbi:MAG: hypothetical protein R6W48_04405 [Gaiellaceae bacterium]